MGGEKISLSNPFKKRKMNRQCEQQYGKVQAGVRVYIPTMKDAETRDLGV